MRLIDADALYKSFGASGNCNNCPLDAYKCQYYNEHTLMEFCERIEDAPTVDAVEVVRCKDCIYCKRFNDVWYLPKKDELLCTRYVETYHTTENDFCSRGERREDGKTG